MAKSIPVPPMKLTDEAVYRYEPSEKIAIADWRTLEAKPESEPFAVGGFVTASDAYKSLIEAPLTTLPHRECKIGGRELSGFSMDEWGTAISPDTTKKVIVNASDMISGYVDSVTYGHDSSSSGSGYATVTLKVPTTGVESRVLHEILKDGKAYLSPMRGSSTMTTVEVPAGK